MLRRVHVAFSKKADGDSGMGARQLSKTCVENFRLAHASGAGKKEDALRHARHIPQVFYIGSATDKRKCVIDNACGVQVLLEELVWCLKNRAWNANATGRPLLDILLGCLNRRLRTHSRDCSSCRQPFLFARRGEQHRDAIRMETLDQCCEIQAARRLSKFPRILAEPCEKCGRFCPPLDWQHTAQHFDTLCIIFRATMMQI